MQPEIIQLGAVFAAMTLIGYAVMSFFTGAAFANGSTIREALTPGLRSLRDGSPKSRSDLADATLMAGVAFSVAATLLESPFAGGLLAVGMMVARKTVQQLSAAEHKLMALAGQASADMAIGVIAPMGLAHMLLGNWMLFGAHAALCLSLSWPAGGPGRRAGAWKPAWVQA